MSKTTKSTSCYYAFTLSLSVFIKAVSSHGNLFIPSPRNAVERFLPEFFNGKSPETPCTCANGLGNGVEGCDQGIRAGGGGQPCMWFNQVGFFGRTVNILNIKYRKKDTHLSLFMCDILKGLFNWL